MPSEETERTEQRAVNVLADETGRSREEFEPDFEENPLPDMDEIDWGPARRSLEEGEPCPECEYPFDSDEWDVRHINGPSLGEDWIYTCPNCEQETCVIGT